MLAEPNGREDLGSGISLWRALIDQREYLSTLATLSRQAPFRHMQTPGGRQMSVAMSNCGDFGWISDLSGYRYEALDPGSGKPWPAIPELWHADAVRIARLCGYPAFAPNACLINRYEVGARMSSHQDRNEADFSQPVVSISLGLPARFVFHGQTRSGRPRAIELGSGDVLVWGGPSRLYFHGVRPVKAGQHPLCGAYRYNLTLRYAAD